MMKILEKFTKDFNHEKYILLWKNCTITSEQWSSRRYIDHWQELDKMTLSDDQEVLIIRHQKKLFNELVKMHVDKTTLHIESKDKIPRKIIINNHLKLIDTFVRDCENKDNNKLLADVFNMVSFRAPLLVLEAYHKIAGTLPSPIRKRYSLTVPSKPGFSQWFIAEIIYQYQLVISLTKSKRKSSKTPNTEASFKSQKTLRKQKPSVKQLTKLKEIFHDPNDLKPCLSILRDVSKPAIDNRNHYIGKNKGIFPLWIRVLQSHRPSLIKPHKDATYKDLLNNEIIGLNLTKDASEFRKEYKRLVGLDLEMKSLLSQLSQNGKLGK